MRLFVNLIDMNGDVVDEQIHAKPMRHCIPAKQKNIPVPATVRVSFSDFYIG
jgi:hypothetical protein